MTPEHIHDALTLLPSDLIAEVDKKRSGKPKVIVWKRYAAMAACFALVLCSGWFCMQLFGPKGATESMKEVPAEAAMMQAAEEANGFGADSATPEAQAAAVCKEEAAEAEAPAAQEETLCALPTAPVREDDTAEDVQTDTTNQSASTANGQTLCIDHAHLPAGEAQIIADPITGWCGNTSATISIDGEEYTIWGTDAITLTDILINLDYDPANLCRCMAQFTAGTETGTGYEVNLSEYFVRFNGGQASLTQEQADALREIIEKLGG